MTMYEFVFYGSMLGLHI